MTCVNNRGDHERYVLSPNNGYGTPAQFLQDKTRLQTANTGNLYSANKLQSTSVCSWRAGYPYMYFEVVDLVNTTLFADDQVILQGTEDKLGRAMFI